MTDKIKAAEERLLGIIEKAEEPEKLSIAVAAYRDFMSARCIAADIENRSLASIEIVRRLDAIDEKLSALLG